MRIGFLKPADVSLAPFRVRWQAQRDTALDSGFVTESKTIQSVVAATLCRRTPKSAIAALLISLLLANATPAVDAPVKLEVNWQKVTRVSRTTPTLQVVVNPLLRRG